VASAGTSTLVVTPPGETPTAPDWAGSGGWGESSLVDVGGEADVDGFCSFDEQPTTVSISSAVNKATRRRYLRMPPNLCNASAPVRGACPHGPAGCPEGRDSSAHRESRPIRAQSDSEQGRRRYGTGQPDPVVPSGARLLTVRTGFLVWGYTPASKEWGLSASTAECCRT